MVLGPITNTTPTTPVTGTAPAATPTPPPDLPKPETPNLARDGSQTQAPDAPPAAPVNLEQVVVPPPTENPPVVDHPPLVPVDSATPPPMPEGQAPCPTDPPPGVSTTPGVPVVFDPPPTPNPPVVEHPPLVPVDSPTPPPPPADQPPCPTEPPKPVTPTAQPPEPPKPPVTPTPKPTPKPPVAKGRSFATQGDPIVRTGDGMHFSLNKPGKYTSLKSTSGDFLMQQEVSKTKDHRHYNTAFGFQIGKDKLSLDTHGGTGTATLKLNGKEVKLGFIPVSMKLPDGGTLKYDPKTNKIHIHTPQGDDITVTRTVNAAKTHYLNVKVDMAETRPAGSVRGVLGNMDDDGDAKNDAVMRDGKPFTGAIGSLWKTPEKFIDEWRSRPDESIL